MDSSSRVFGSAVILLVLYSTCQATPQKPRLIPPANPNDQPRLPPNKTCNVLIIGASVAGLSTAMELAERGFKVKIREADSVPGGRLATKKVNTLKEVFNVSRTFVSWMHNHYQFHDIRTRLGVKKNFQPWEKIDYYFKNYKPEQIYNTRSYPWNIIEMLWRSKNIHFTDDVAAIFRSSDLRDYNYDKVFKSMDQMTGKTWRANRKVPQAVYDILFEPLIAEVRNNVNTTSAANLLTYMQLYYMSDKKADEAMRDVANVSYDKALINSWITYLTKTKNVSIDYNKKVSELEFMVSDPRFPNVTSDDTAPDEKYDYVVLATDLESSRVILKNTMNDFTGVPWVYVPLNAILNKLQGLKSAAPYKVLRVWYDKQPNKDRPAVIITPDMTPLNLVVQHHRLEDEYKKWAAKSNGSMIEYQLNQWTYGDLNATEILKRLEPSLQKVFPELFANKSKVLYTSLDTFQNAPSFDTNMEEIRPAYNSTSGIPNLYFAGDWLLTTYPAALMEKAVSTGREVANQILLNERVKQVPLTVTSSIGPGW